MARYCPPPGLVGRPNEIEAQKHALAVRHVADDAAHRQRQLLDQRGCRDDLLALDECRLLVDIDDFKIVPALEVLVGLDLRMRQ